MQETEASPTVDDLLRGLLENKGSDLHVQSGEVPIGRFHGELGRQAAQGILNAWHREEEQARSRHSRQFVRFRPSHEPHAF